MNKNYKLIVAYDDNFGIGLNNSIPWYLPEDLKRFRSITINSNVIMGYKTFESILKKNKKPLVQRNNIVLTRKTIINSKYNNCFFYNKIDDILNNYQNAWVIGGQEIYELFFPFVTEVFVTKVKGVFNCDKFFTIREHLNWKVIYKEDFENYSFINYSKY